MSDKPSTAKERLKALPVTAETPGFKPEEMSVCEKCARPNPPTRAKCFYCGEPLKIAEGREDLVAPNLRPMEAWEKGFNIIFNGTAFPAENIRAAATLLRREPDEIKSIFEKQRPMPLARAESLSEAELIQQRLAAAGIGSFIWPDEEALIDQLTRRLRGLEITAETITFLPFNNGESPVFRWSELAVIVQGSLFEKKIASTEKRKKNEEKLVTESTETSHDEPVLDLYTSGDNIGWRVLTKGFDFSCLGPQKGMLAVENIKKLAVFIKEHAPQTAVDDGYIKLRGALGQVWENEHKMASHKWERESMGKFHFDNVTAVNNITQFTRYSRLQWRLLKEK
ncbi:MAG TPA: hypothetical protein VGO50_18300 [Pyrinomonadaceae bacterium]|jgi:hypothetical protein|nr:hypothetical protein [Pyrinomonadaceae bacterium]